jgi:hypothetical protein
VSQVFIAFDLPSISPRDETAAVVDSIIADLKVRYPGERAAADGRRSAEERVPVDPVVWEWLQKAVSQS